MLKNISEGVIIEEERKVVEYLKQRKFKRVLDIGGVQRPWARPYVTHYLDLITPEYWAERYPEMKEYKGFWDKKFIQKDVESNLSLVDKFDFIICTQCLEHLRDPGNVINKMSCMANEGFISVPHKIFELRKGVHWGYNFRGALPHRWINDVREGVLYMYPKLNFIECMEFEFDKLEKIPDLSFWWEGSIPVEVIDDTKFDFADPKEAINYFKQAIQS